MSPRPVDLPAPDYAPAHALARDGRFSEALVWIEHALGERRGEQGFATGATQALAQLAREAADAGELGTAERMLDAALRLRPGYADLHFQRALVLLAGARRPEARRALDEALRVNPRFLAARVERALLDAREGLIGEALDALRTLERESTIEEPRAFQQGLKSLERADWDAAGSLFKRALRLSDPGLERQLQQFNTLMEEGRIERAAQVLRETLPPYPGYPDLHALLGSVELRLGHYDDAVASLTRALELNPDYHAARLHFARALDALGLRVAAAEQVALVLQLEPANAQALELQEAWSTRGRVSRSREKSGRNRP